MQRCFMVAKRWEQSDCPSVGTFSSPKGQSCPIQLWKGISFHLKDRVR